MPPPRIPTSLCAQLSRLSITPAARHRPQILFPRSIAPTSTSPTTTAVRTFTSTRPAGSWLIPRTAESRKSRKGRCRVPTGGSMRGTTVEWGDYGLRMRDHDRRISATQLRIAEETIRKRLRGMKFRLYHRVSADIGVYTSGNESRMGKGKGSFDHWTTRMHVSKVLFELKGDLHEQVVKDAFRLAGNKLPGLWETIKKGDPPKMGLTKVGVNGVTKEDLLRPRKKIEAIEASAASMPAAA